MRRSRLAVLLLPLAAACADRPGDGAGEPGGTVIIAVPGAFTPSLPPFAMTATTVNIAAQVYDRLAQIGPDLNSFGDVGFQPRLARRWTWAPDSLSIAFELHPDARWHDGRPVRASDVRFSFELASDPAASTAVGPLLRSIDSVSVRDSLTAVAWYSRRSPEQFYDLAYQLYILPEHVLGGIPRAQLATTDAASVLVGTGRFRLGRFEPGSRLELVSDTANYRGRARLDRVIFTVASDGGAAVAQILSGQADVFEFIPPDMVPRLDSGSAARAVRAPGLGITYLGLNQLAPRGGAPHPIFSDRAVRRAIAMAVDREAMLRNVFDTLGVLAAGPFARLVADTAVVLPPFDRAAANALLNSAGWRMAGDSVRARGGRRLSFGILYPTSSRPRERYAVLLQEQLRSIGARVEIVAVDFPTFMARQNSGDFDAALISANPDANLGGARQYWTAQGMAAGGQNFVHYSNPRFDAMLDSAIASFNQEQRRDMARRAWQMLVDDAPAVWLYDLLFMHAVHRRIRPTDLRADGWWAGLADWSIPAAERIDRDRIGLRPAQQ